MRTTDRLVEFFSARHHELHARAAAPAAFPAAVCTGQPLGAPGATSAPTGLVSSGPARVVCSIGAVDALGLAQWRVGQTPGPGRPQPAL